MAQRQVQGHDGLFGVFWGVRRMALGSCGSFLRPGGIGGIVAIPPFVEPAFRAGQLPTDVLDLVVGKIVVDSLATTLFLALGHDGCLWELRVDLPMDHLFSMSWHN